MEEDADGESDDDGGRGDAVAVVVGGDGGVVESRVCF